MSEERLARLEDMMGQLIGMVGKVLSEQHEMRQLMEKMDGRLERVETEQSRFNDSILYLMDKSTQHDHDIHVLKRHILK